MYRSLTALALGALAFTACARQVEVESEPLPVTLPEAPQVVPSNASALPAGTRLEVRLDQELGTRSSTVGDEFTATVRAPVIAQNGDVVVPEGAKVIGRVSGLQRSERAGQAAAIRLEFQRLTFDGRTYPFEARIIATELEERGATREETLRDAAAGAAAGAVLGAVIGEGQLQNILLGGAIGAAAGTVISLGMGDVDAVLPAGTEMQVQATQLVALR